MLLEVEGSWEMEFCVWDASAGVGQAVTGITVSKGLFGGLFSSIINYYFSPIIKMCFYVPG